MTFTTDKIKPHGYFRHYLKLASKLPSDATVCEVGVLNGESLILWQHLFPDGVIIGVDKDPDATWPEGTKRIVATQDDPSLGSLVAEQALPGLCDLIIDDASHIGSLTLETFRLLWPLVRPGGYYVVEDWADPWVFPDWVRWPQVDPSTAGDELVDKVPRLIEALNDGADEVIYTKLGLVIIRKEAK